ncbi:u3 small nucleolar rna-associated [Nannochloropsis oceanica]
MPYASLRNAIPRKTNKERSQPAARKKYGLLEKHKDYVERAKDFNRKKKTISSLRQKALFKNPDEFYFAMTKSKTKAERLQAGLHFLLDEPANKHTVFVDSEADVEAFDPAKHFNTVPALAGRAFNRPRKETLEAATSVQGVASVPQLQKVRKQREKAYKELGARLKRSETMKQVLERMQVEKNVMGKGRKRKVQDAEDGKPPVYKWKRERRK